MSDNANRTAFPNSDTLYAGLTKLEYAAIQICAGMWANRQAVESAAGCTNPAAFLAGAAIDQARALFAELEKSDETQ